MKLTGSHLISTDRPYQTRFGKGTAQPSPRELIEFLKSEHFTERMHHGKKSGKGSHVVMYHEQDPRRRTTIPTSCKTIANGTLYAILGPRQTDTREAFRRQFLG